jgi:glutathione-regulated potassium-efflux system ancillary protein KefC
MSPQSFVYSAVLLLVVASIAVAISRHLGLGSILGLLVTGVIVGPHTPGPFLTNEVDGVRQFTELGVVLLLFLIGLEIKPRHLWEMRRVLFGLGGLQIFCSAIAIGGFFWLQGYSDFAVLVLGSSFALSSTAFVVQMLREHGEMTTTHGQISFAVLLMQDLAVIPLLSVLPLLAPGIAGFSPSLPVWQQSLLIFLMISSVIMVGKYFIPGVLDYLARKNNREGFFLVAMAAMFISALAMDYAGMSMGLGAFLMGMMLSTSRYSLQIEASIEPHKGLLMSLFFVAVGMSVDVSIVARHPVQFFFDVLCVILIKVFVLYALVRAFGSGKGNAIRVASLLAQGGEFGFVVLGTAKAANLIDDELFAVAVAVISVSMLLTPFMAKWGNLLAIRFTSSDRHTQIDRLQKISADIPIRAVIAGYGRVGHTIGTILKHREIPFVAFDSDASVVAKWRQEGHPVFYGDITHSDLFSNSAVQGAEILILTIDNGPHAIRVTSLIRSRIPSIAIVARARDLKTCDALINAGVTTAVPEILEASLRLAAESLAALGETSDDTTTFLSGLRTNEYSLVRGSNI